MRTARLKTAAGALALFAANGYVARELFTTAYTGQMGSIEAAYIALARYITGHWEHLTWFPLWYNGVPYQNTYPPLLHLVVAAAAQSLRLSPAVAYHAVTAAFYCLGPVTLFWLALRLSGSRVYSFAAALLYSVFSPVTLLIPAARVDVGGLWHARRFQALVQWGEGPHVTAMTLLPVAILLLDAAVAKRRPGYYLLAALSMAAVVLTNWLGAVALAAAVRAWLLSFQGAARRAWLTAAGIGAAAYLIASPWIPPSTLAAIRTNAQQVGGPFPMNMLQLRYAGLLLIALAVLELSFERWKPARLLRFSLVFALLMAALTLGSAWFGAYILPQPERYQLEMEMGLILVAVFAVRPLIESMRGRQKALVLAGFLLFSWFQLKTYRGFARWMDRPIDIRRTVEYKAARWFDAHMDGRRVFAGGSAGFWLNAFSDTPQLSGGFDQGITNPLAPAVIYQLYSGEGAGAREGEIAEAWLKAFGVYAVFAGGPQSGEFFKPFRNPRKFQGRLKELWRDGQDDFIYEVPQSTASLAHVMPPQAVVARAPAGGLDIAPLQPYLASLDDPALPPAEFRWIQPEHARITADLRPGQLVSVQITWHPGWHAAVNGRLRRAWRDGLGLLVVEPDCAGRCTVELTYDGGREMLLMRILSWLTLLAALGWICAGPLRVRFRRAG